MVSSASTSERRPALPKSPTYSPMSRAVPDGLKSRSYQKVLVPCMGKVGPPLSPWKERIAMTMKGP